jgi:hypothetical protein
MSIFFPHIGTKIKLVDDWTFPLHNEYRNATVIESLGILDAMRPIDPTNQWHKFADVTLPAETILKVDRIYIRKGAADYDSITFNIIYSPHSHLYNKKKLRFWAKLTDINGNMNGEVID